LERLKEPIRTLKLSASDRIGISGDAMALAKAGLLRTHAVLELLTAYVNENNYTVWADIGATLDQLIIILAHTSFYDKFQHFIRQLYGKITAHLGWDAKSSDSHSDSLLRAVVLGKMGHAGDEATVEEAKKRFKKFREGNNDALPADLRSAVYRICVDHEKPGETFWEEVLKLSRETDLHEEKERCQRALGKSNNPEKIHKTLEWALTSEVRDQDTVFVLESISGNSKGRDMCWEFVKKNWPELEKRYSGGFLLNRLVKSTANFASEERAKEVEKFFEEHKAPAAERAVKQAIEGIRLNAEWLARDGADLEKWFKDH